MIGLNQLRFLPGEVWGILGPNGCGKTTFLHTLAGLRASHFGEPYLNQQPINTLSRKYIAQQIGVLLQESAYNFEISVQDYCRAARYPHLNYFQSVNATDVQIINDALHLLNLESIIHKNIRHLSGGEKRRMAIAALLIQTPKIYLLDEPTNHLDIHYQHLVLRHFAQQTETVVIMTLHDVNLAQRYCHKILLMFNQHEFIAGNRDELLTRDHVSRLYAHPMQRILQGENTVWLG